jgi:hypothetical protein
VTRLQAGTARNLSSISNKGKGLLYCQKLAIRNSNAQTFLFYGLGIKKQGPEADNHERHSNNMKDKQMLLLLLIIIIIL